jgi:hypothetical protein
MYFLTHFSILSSSLPSVESVPALLILWQSEVTSHPSRVFPGCWEQGVSPLVSRLSWCSWHHRVLLVCQHSSMLNDSGNSLQSFTLLSIPCQRHPCARSRSRSYWENGAHQWSLMSPGLVRNSTLWLAQTLGTHCLRGTLVSSGSGGSGSMETPLPCYLESLRVMKTPHREIGAGERRAYKAEQDRNTY